MNRILAIFIPIIMAASINGTAIKGENDTYISETAYEACVEYGEQYNICPELLMAIIERESAGKPDAENGSCKGLMQISVKWHSGRMERLGVTDIFDERSNVLVGADYLAELFEKYEDTATVLMIYHGERNAVQKGKRGEISSYAEQIIERSAELERIHEKEGGKGVVGIEREELSKIAQALTIEDQEVIAKYIKGEILIAEIEKRYRKMEAVINLTEQALNTGKM